jgi:excisionase family DNA binding protein
MSKRVQYPTQHVQSRLAVSPAEAAFLAGIGRTKLYEAMKAGLLASFKIGKRRLVRVAEVEAWLRRLEEAAGHDRK